MSVSLTALCACLAFIENHLCEALNVTDLAAAAGYSLYHFERIFNKAVHHTPYDYLIRRRLSACAVELVRTRRRISDIAADYQFQNSETFSRAFKRMFGTPPNLFRAKKQLDPRALLAARTLAHLQNNLDGNFLHPQFNPHPARELAGWMSRYPGALLNQVRAALPQAATCYGLTLYPPDWVKNGPFYLAGVETSPETSLPDTFVRFTLPAGLYAAFGPPGPPAALPLTRDYAYQTWLPRSGKTAIPAFDLELHLPGGACQFILGIM